MKNMSIKGTVGLAYDFSEIASLDREVWVAFAASDNNSEILRFAPAFAAMRTADSVPITSQTGDHCWLLPGVEIAIHQSDLSASKMVPGCPFAVVRVSESDGLLRGVLPSDDSDLLEQLNQIAERIEASFHTSADPVLPLLRDCVLEAINPEEQNASFVWSHDRRRSYLLARAHDSWTLTQHYDDPRAIVADVVVPLDAGNEIVTFGSDGGTELSSAQCAALRIQFGLSLLVEAALPTAQGRRIWHMIMALSSSIADRLSPVPSLGPCFSTTKSQLDAPVFSACQSVRIAGKDSEESLELLLDAYSQYPNSVDLKILVAYPKILNEGSNLGITFGSVDVPSQMVKVILADDRKGGLYGLGKIPCSWEQLPRDSSTKWLDVEIRLI